MCGPCGGGCFGLDHELSLYNYLGAVGSPPPSLGLVHELTSTCVPEGSRNRDIHPSQTPNLLYPYQQSPRPRGAAPNRHRRTRIEWLPSPDSLPVFHSNSRAGQQDLFVSRPLLHHCTAPSPAFLWGPGLINALVLSHSHRRLSSRPPKGRHSTSLIYLRRASIFPEKTHSRQESVTSRVSRPSNTWELPTTHSCSIPEERGQALTTLEL